MILYIRSGISRMRIIPFFSYTSKIREVSQLRAIAQILQQRALSRKKNAGGTCPENAIQAQSNNRSKQVQNLMRRCIYFSNCQNMIIYAHLMEEWVGISSERPDLPGFVALAALSEGRPLPKAPPDPNIITLNLGASSTGT